MSNQIEEVRAAISAKRAEQERLSRCLGKIGEQRREVANRIRGFAEPREDHPNRQRLLDTLKHDEDELADCDQKIAAVNKEIQAVTSALEELAAIRFGEDEVFAQSLVDHDAAKQRFIYLQEREKFLSNEKESAENLLPKVAGELSSAQSRKSKALSVVEVDRALEELSAAQLRVTNTEELLKNLGAELAAVGRQKDIAGKALEKAEAAVFAAHCAVIVRDLRSMPEFKRVFAKLEDAYAAHVSAGHFQNFGVFVTHVFLGEGNTNIDRARLTELEVADRLSFFNEIVGA